MAMAWSLPAILNSFAAYRGSHIAPFTIANVIWHSLEYYDKYVIMAILCSDYEELQNIPVWASCSISGLDSAVCRSNDALLDMVIGRLRKAVELAAKDEHERWLTMLAYLGRVED